MRNLTPFEKEIEIRKRLLAFMKKNPKGLTTTEIGAKTGISRKTLEKHLQLLVFENEIYMKQWGPTRVYYPNHRVHYIDFKKLTINNRTYWFDIMKNEYGSYLIIQEKRMGPKDKDWKTKGSILIPLKENRKFMSALTNILNSNKLLKLMKEE
ncbi:MAG: hypothetical protein ABIB47_05265 [Candidatus Woesearchaeota archaeon]